MRVENGKKVFSVREVNSYIGNIIKNDYLLKNICFEGEVSSFSKGPTGHLYITLKDCTAPGDLPEGAPYNGILRVNVWKSVAAKLNLTTVKQGDILFGVLRFIFLLVIVRFVPLDVVHSGIILYLAP